jgi:hypothetical protein
MHGLLLNLLLPKRNKIENVVVIQSYRPCSQQPYALKHHIGTKSSSNHISQEIGAGNSIAFQPWIFTKIILPSFMKWLKVIIDDKNRMEPIIMNSRLDWTIVRCPNIVDKPSKGS